MLKNKFLIVFKIFCDDIKGVIFVEMVMIMLFLLWFFVVVVMFFDVYCMWLMVEKVVFMISDMLLWEINVVIV